MDNLVVTIKKLCTQIQKNEDYIAYLKKELTIRDDEINILKVLRKVEADVQSKEKNLSAVELQLKKISNELFFLQHRIYKLQKTMTLNMTHLPPTNTPVFDLIKNVKTNIKLLADSARGDNTLLIDEINNLQTQTELGLTKIQNGYYTFENEVTQLRQEVINLKDINRNQQELTNKLDEYRDEYYQIKESLEGAYEDITEGGFVYDRLKQKILFQNNLPINNNRTSIVDYELKKFNGYSIEDLEEYIEEFRLWLIDSKC
ncbi:hypothetical protein Glove_120g25 [Diversispora epigaea]|uniref:Uncharacterized protein n=1 Tax=Diversispora epigaea TaxID=1348612 RepID=A0A397IZD1_9GLOM|nr:hypothetical protein Glove_120g25 [Diversispora epigaea]